PLIVGLWRTLWRTLMRGSAWAACTRRAAQIPSSKMLKRTCFLARNSPRRLIVAPRSQNGGRQRLHRRTTAVRHPPGELARDSCADNYAVVGRALGAPPPDFQALGRAPTRHLLLGNVCA